MNYLRFIPAVVAGLLLAAPATSLADRKYTVYRDNDGDGHYNKKTINVNNGSYYRGGGKYYGGNSYYRGGNYNGGNYYYSRPASYYGRSYYGSPYYGSSYYRPYSYPSSYYYSRPAVTFSFNRSYTSRSSSYSGSLAADVQRSLRRQGYYYGAIDGDVGPGTRAAIRAYQADRGLSRTGRIDRSLVRALGVG